MIPTIELESVRRTAEELSMSLSHVTLVLETWEKHAADISREKRDVK